jgi:hypothetical protein
MEIILGTTLFFFSVVVLSFVPTFLALAKQKGRNPWLVVVDIPLIFIPLLMQMLIYTGIGFVFLYEIAKQIPSLLKREGRDALD